MPSNEIQETDLHREAGECMISIMRLAEMMDAMGGTVCVVAAGELLFSRGSEVSHLFLVESGLVHLIRYQESGAPTVMQRARAGDIVAEASLFADQYHCDASAVSDGAVTRFSIAAVRRRLAEDAGFARAYAEHLAHEVHRMRVRSEIMGMKTVAARLDAWRTLNPWPAKGHWSAVADDIGVSREALYREIAKRKPGASARAPGGSITRPPRVR